MRNGNKTRHLLSLARFFVLALCFTMVFAFALSSNSKLVANAYDVVNQDKDDDATIGSATAFYGDHGQLTGMDFNYPGLSTGTKSWTYTETYYNVVPTTSNHQVFKVKGDTNMYTHVNEANHWLWGVSNGAAAAEVHGAINFNLTGFIAQMVQNDNVTVKAKVTANIGAKEGDSTWLVKYVNNLFYSAIAVPAGKVMTGGLSYDLRNNKSASGDDKTGFVSGFQNSSTTSAQDRTSNEVTLNKDTPGLGFALGCGWNQQLGSYDHHVYMSNLRVTYTITFNDSVTDSDSMFVGDNAAPIASSLYGIENSYVKGTRGSGYAPYLTDATQAPVYHESIQKGIKLDSVTDGAGKLQSYTNKSIDTITYNSRLYSYYKFAQTEYVDMYNYSGESSVQAAVAKYGSDAFKTIGVGDRLITGISDGKLTSTTTSDSTHLRYVSGIKTVTINDSTTFNVWDSTDRAKTKEITVEDDNGNPVVVGYARLNYINRGRVTVMLYMVDNGTVQTTITDFGGAENKTRIEFSGIDTTAPTSKVVDGEETINGGTNISLEGFLSDTTSIPAWLRTNKLEAEGSIDIKEDDTSAGYSPYLWFYTVNRADSLAALNNIAVTQFANYAAVKSAGINPIAYGEINSFTYDFVNGTAKAYGGGEQGNPSSISDNVTGHGYYRFTFYLFDLAGNTGSVKSFYLKVDYDKPEYTLDFSFDKNGTVVPITAAENGKWATGNATLKFTLTSGGFSGYTFRFEDANNALHAFVVNGAGEYSGDNYVASIVDYITSATDVTKPTVGNTMTININGTAIKVVYALEDGKSTFTFSVPAPDTAYFEWISSFSAFCGQYSNIAAIDSDEQAVEFVDNNWKGGVKVLIDKIAPTAPLFEEEEGYLSALEGYGMPQNRMWFTTSYNLPVVLAFSDSIIDSDYASGLKIHYGIKVLKSLADLQALEGLNIEEKYRTAINIQQELGFDGYILTLGNALDGDATDFTLQLLSAQTAGMRAIYVWAEDQAGNVSQLSRYYVLVDTNNYSVSAAVKDNANLENGFASITLTNEEGDPVTTIKRGQTLSFAISLADTYVPFKFTQNGTVLLENYNQIRTWNNLGGNNARYLDVQGYSALNITFDDFDNLSDLAKTNRFEFAARKVVTYILTNNSVGYTAAPTDVSAWMNYGYPLSADAFEYRFVDANGNLLYEDENGLPTTEETGTLFVPTKVGNYRVRIYIPKENDSFVTDDFQTDDEGNQIFTWVAYNVIKGRAVITVNRSTSEFGKSAQEVLGMLSYEVSGIDKANMAAENIFVELALNATLASGDTFKVGTYAIINSKGDYSQAENYEVTFVSNEHVVTRRAVAIDAWSAKKDFRENDPEFKFGVALSQFEGLYKSAQDIVNDIFAGYRKDTEANEEGYVIFFADGRINREAGEGVRQYDFVSDSTLFDVDTNYSVLVQTAKYKFVIEKRIVKLDVSGQSSVYPFGTTIDEALTGKINPAYKISAKDMVVASEIEALFANGAKLYLASSGTKYADDANYDAYYKYKILLGETVTDGNIEIVLDTEKDVEYVIYVTAQSAVVVRVKDGAKFEFTFGYVWNENSLTFDADKFVVSGEPSGDYTTIKWTVSGINGLPNAGRYIVNITDAKLYNGETELTDSVFVEPVTVTINPAKIVVSPTADKLSKVYGEEDSVFGIGFEILSIDGKSIAKDGTYANISYNDILNEIKGAYVRAIYRDSERLSLANRYDDATNSNGFVYGTDGRYYSFAVGTTFFSQDSNFTVDANLDLTKKLSVEQYALTLHTKDFVGLSSAISDSAKVPYGTVKMYDLSSLLVLATDDVYLTANANYLTDSDGKLTVGQTAIIFDTLGLGGKKANNYVLAKVVNDGVDSMVNGKSESREWDIDSAIEIEIIYIDNVNGIDNIRITNGIIALVKGDITISKQYDNNKNLTAANISFADGEGTKTLIGLTKKLIVEESDSFTGAEVSSNYVVNVALFFAFEDFDSIEIRRTGIYENPDIVITENVTYNNEKGIKIVLKNMSASIVKRVIGEGSFLELSAVNRDYNATDEVDMTYTFKQGALAEGDTVQTVGLKLKGKSANANAGTHLASVESATVIDKNYDVDVAAINNEYTSLKVEIAKARLVPNITFNDRVYNGSSAISASDWNAKLNNEGKGTFTSVQYATNLERELGKFSFDVSKVEFMLSLNGEEDDNVADNGKHNVMVRGLEVVFDDTDCTASEKEQILKNYVLEGSRYSKVDKQYTKINNLEFGAIDEFELIDAVNLSKKQIQLIINDYNIEDKVYDGTTEAAIAINITDGRIVAAHTSLLEVVARGEFARKQTGTNIVINNLIATLKVKDSLSESDLAIAKAAINNYELLQYRGTITGNIKERPLLVSVDFGQREYNGDEEVNKSTITYSFKGMIAGDERYYAIQTRNGAYYIDKNVVVESDVNGVVTIGAKDATAYGLYLQNIKEKYKNYTLVYSTTTRDSAKTPVAYEDKQGNIVYGVPASDDNVKEFWYELDKTSKYISASDTAKVADAKQNGAIVGFYKTGNMDVYLVDNSWTDTDGALSEEVNYLKGQGKITQRTAAIRANGIVKVDGSDKFEKTFDGTDLFYGEENVDYQFGKSSVANVILGDDVTIASVAARFDSAYTNAKYVVFTASGIAGADAYNYTIEGEKTSVEVKLSARIAPRKIKAYLADAEAEYGISTKLFENSSIKYTFVGNNNEEYDLVNQFNDYSSFFMEFEKFVLATGIDTTNVNVMAKLAELTYDCVDGVYVRAAEGAYGEFIRLGDVENDRISKLPEATVRFSSSYPVVGDVSRSYTLNEGNAKNYVFVASYTGEGTSKVTVIKKDLYVVTVVNGYTAEYGNFMTADGRLTFNVGLRYLNKDGGNGIIGSQSIATLFASGSVNYLPKVKLGIYNARTHQTVAATMKSKISSDLGADEYYVLYVESDYDYDKVNTVVKNYNVILAGIDTVADSVVEIDGVEKLKTVFDLEGATVKFDTATLTIVLPALEGVSVGSETENNFSFDYSIDENYEGVNRLHDVINGELVTDEVKFVDENGDELEPVNVGTYSGFIRVKRYINADGSFVAQKDSDENGYFIEWNSGAVEKTVVINKANVGLKAKNASEYYNGKTHVYATNDNRISFNTLTGNHHLSKNVDYAISYEALRNGNFEPVGQNDIIDAGKYRVTVKLTSKFLESEIGKNYNEATATAEFQVLRAIVNVTISDEAIEEAGFVKSSEYVEGTTIIKLTSEYVEGKQYSIDYQVAMDGLSNAAAIAIDKSKTKLVGWENIASAGKYSFAIVLIEDEDSNLKASNYVFMKGTGTLELTTNKLSSSDGSHIEINEGKGVVANRLVVKEIKTDNTLVSDMAYLDAVERYVAYMNRNSDVKNIEVAAVLRVNLYLDDQLVLTNGNTTITVALPEKVKNMKDFAIYYVNDQSGLTRLKDYKIENGMLTYTTDYIDGIVFVDLNPDTLEPWVVPTVAATVGTLVAIIIATVVAVVVKKSKLKKLD